MALANYLTPKMQWENTLNISKPEYLHLIALARRDATRTQEYKSQKEQAYIAAIREEAIRTGKAYFAALNTEEGAIKQKAAVARRNAANYDEASVSFQARKYTAKFELQFQTAAKVDDVLKAFTEEYDTATLANDANGLEALRLVARETVLTKMLANTQTRMQAVSLKVRIDADEEKELATAPGLASVTEALQQIDANRERLRLDLMKLENDFTGRMFMEIAQSNAGTWHGAVFGNYSATSSNLFDLTNATANGGGGVILKMA